MAVGIDLGTSNSCVAIAKGGKVTVISNRYGEPISASAVSLPADGPVSVGNAAKAQAVNDPTNTITSSKRLIGRYYFSEEVKKAKAVCSYSIVEGPNHSVRVKVRDQILPIPEISALILREMKEVAEAQLGEPVTEAVITVPAYFNDNQRQATRDAGRIAGLEVLRLLNEPTAAALAYGCGKGLTQKIAVYDLGGGTFDISILEIGEDVFEVLSTCGDTFLGGEDFDDRLLDLFADEFHKQYQINLRNDMRALEVLKAAAEQAKKDLSVEDVAQVRIPEIAKDGNGNLLGIERDVTRDELGKLVEDLIQRTFKVCDEAFQQASLTNRDIDGVILVGGPTRLPLVRDAVSEYFQAEPLGDIDPDQVVAMGAAIHAAALTGQGEDTHLLDVTPLSLRIGVAGGLAETVIERNTPVPIEQTRTFTTFSDFQESVSIRIYQGEARTAANNEMLGEFEFAGFRSARRGEVKINVTFEIDTDGIVNVTAEDEETGQVASTEIRLSSGLSEDEIQELVVKQQASGAPAPTPAASPHTAVVPLDELETDDLDADGAEPELETFEAPVSETPVQAAAPAPPADPVADPGPVTDTGTGETELSEDDFPEVSGSETATMQAAGAEELGAVDDGVFDSLDELEVVPPTAEEKQQARQHFDTSGGDLSASDVDGDDSSD